MSQHHDVTAGIDIGDRYSHLCLLDTESGEVIEEGRIPTNTKDEGFRETLFRCRADAHSHRNRYPLAVDQPHARGVRTRDPGR
jgi:predicted NBD/HSP70 family sugar kinase